MKLTELAHSLFRRSLEWMYFLLVIILIFNVLTDFFQKIGLLGNILTITELQYYGMISFLLAINNLISKKFFGLELFRG